MQSPKLRRAVTADARSLAAVIDAAYEKYKNRIPDLPAVSDGCADEIRENLVWVATIDDAIVGGLFLIPSESYMKLANLAVHPGYGGQGIGSKLMKLAEQTARQMGFAEMRLNTHAQMPENISLYEHLGWDVFARKDNTVSMRKQLGDTST